MATEKVYFLSCIELLNEKAFIVLEPVPEKIVELNDESPKRKNGFKIISYALNVWKKSITEGDFVYLKENNQLISANSSRLAKKHRWLNNIYRGLLQKASISEQQENTFEPSDLFSYHINVGHGNCSLLVMKKNGMLKIWMVDCSNYDYKKKKSYQANIDACIDYVKNKHNITAFHIEKFFLTHTHFDHYSGIEKLINQRYLSNKSELWLNCYYSYPSPRYNRILRKLFALKCNIIEPIKLSSSKNINIWHPLRRTIRTKTKKYNKNSVEIISKINNSSVVINFKFGKIKIVFPGDIEAGGWNKIIDCRPRVNHAQYFCISHHGSINGHERICHKKKINMSQCGKFVSKAILMGRDKAYPSIYSPNVINDWGTRLVKSEHNNSNKPCAFLELDLIRNAISYH